METHHPQPILPTLFSNFVQLSPRLVLPVKQKELATHALTHSIKCGIHHMPEASQTKVMCDVPHLCQFIPIEASVLLALCMPITQKS